QGAAAPARCLLPPELFRIVWLAGTTAEAVTAPQAGCRHFPSCARNRTESATAGVGELLNLPASFPESAGTVFFVSRKVKTGGGLGSIVWYARFQRGIVAV